MKVAVVGAGPAGSLLAHHLARDGAAVTVFDASHPREKPCGGGLTAKALALLPPAPARRPAARPLGRTACRFESGTGEGVELAPAASPWRWARGARWTPGSCAAPSRPGRGHVAERVVAVDAAGGLRTAAGRTGAVRPGGRRRRRGLSRAPHVPRPHAAGAPDHGRGLVRAGRRRPWSSASRPASPATCGSSRAPTTSASASARRSASVPTRDAAGRGSRPRSRAPSRPSPIPTRERYAHTIPSPSADPRSILEIAGERWALVGDAAALADPITGEGIYYALRSAEVLAETLRAHGSPARLSRGRPRGLRPRPAEGRRSPRPLLRAGLRPPHDRLQRAQPRPSATSWPTSSSADQGYVGLKRRLLRAGPRFLWESALSRFRPAA